MIQNESEVKELLNGGQVKQLVYKIMFMEIKLS